MKAHREADFVETQRFKPSALLGLGRLRTGLSRACAVQLQAPGGAVGPRRYPGKARGRREHARTPCARLAAARVRTRGPRCETRVPRRPGRCRRRPRVPRPSWAARRRQRPSRGGARASRSLRP